MRWLSRGPHGVGSVNAPLAWGGEEERLRDAGAGMPGCPLCSGPPGPSGGWGWLHPCTPGTTEHPNAGAGQSPSSALLKDN